MADQITPVQPGLEPLAMREKHGVPACPHVVRDSMVRDSMAGGLDAKSGCHAAKTSEFAQLIVLYSPDIAIRMEPGLSDLRNERHGGVSNTVCLSVRSLPIDDFPVSTYRNDC